MDNVVKTTKELTAYLFNIERIYIYYATNIFVTCTVIYIESIYFSSFFFKELLTDNKWYCFMSLFTSTSLLLFQNKNDVLII